MSVYFERPLALADHSNETRAIVQARGVLTGYFLYLTANPLGQEVRHPEDLPTSKRILIDAMRILLAHEPRPEQSAQLQKVGLFLAQFQPSDKPHHPETSEDDALSEWIVNVSSRLWVSTQGRCRPTIAQGLKIGPTGLPSGSQAFVADTATIGIR